MNQKEEVPIHILIFVFSTVSVGTHKCFSQTFKTNLGLHNMMWFFQVGTIQETKTMLCLEFLKAFRS